MPFRLRHGTARSPSACHGPPNLDVSASLFASSAVAAGSSRAGPWHAEIRVAIHAAQGKLQYPVVNGGDPARGVAFRVQCQKSPLYKPARAFEHQAGRLRARAIFFFWFFFSCWRTSPPRGGPCAGPRFFSRTEPIVPFVRLGAFLGTGTRGGLVNFFVRSPRCASLVPPIRRRAPRVSPAPRPCARGALLARQRPGSIERRRCRPPCLPLHGRHHRRKPKAARCLHRNLFANVLQVEAWYGPPLNELPAGDQFTHAGGGAPAPFTISFALTGCALLSIPARWKKRASSPTRRDHPGRWGTRDAPPGGVHCFPAAIRCEKPLGPTTRVFSAAAGFFPRGGSCVRGAGMAVPKCGRQRVSNVRARTICEAYGLVPRRPAGATANSGCSPNRLPDGNPSGLPLPSTRHRDPRRRRQPACLFVRRPPGESRFAGPQVKWMATGFRPRRNGRA